MCWYQYVFSTLAIDEYRGVKGGWKGEGEIFYIIEGPITQQV